MADRQYLLMVGFILSAMAPQSLYAADQVRVCVTVVERTDVPDSVDDAEPETPEPAWTPALEAAPTPAPAPTPEAAAAQAEPATGEQTSPSPTPPPPDAETPPSEAEIAAALREETRQLAAARSALEQAMPSKITRRRSGNGSLPHGQTAVVYLQRLIEHYVTHAPRHESVQSDCGQTITVELYPLEEGWTAFARYSGTAREEKVDQLFADELNAFAERAVSALLNDVPISRTITRENVLKDDSRRRVQRVKGSSHFILELGTRLLVAMADQVIESGERQGELERKLTLFHPIEFGLGYRGRFESWGLEITNHAAIGLNQTSSSRNPGGGHIDYGGNAGLAIHFLRYHNPRGLTSFYGGAGASFDLLWFRVINPATSADRHSTLFSGGLSGQGVIGWEFMRAAAVQFFLQGELNIPAYLVRTENSVGRMKSWAPGVTLRIGMVF